MARPTPVLPEVGSMMVPPGPSSPSRSAASIIATAGRSLTLPPGFVVSSFATIWHCNPSVTRRRRTSGVLPTRSRSESAISGSSGSSSMETGPFIRHQLTVAGNEDLALLPVMQRRQAASRLQGSGPTIFAEMSALAASTGAVNLGQGFPDTDGPAVIAEAAIDAIRAGHNQYPPGIGIADLRHAITDHQRRFYGIELDPDTEVLVTAGATEALAATFLALCDPGDEVITFEPWYDAYAADASLAGAQLRGVLLHPPEYRFDVDALRAAITPATKFLLLNSPHNPTGKVFDREE